MGDQPHRLSLRVVVVVAAAAVNLMTSNVGYGSRIEVKTTPDN